MGIDTSSGVGSKLKVGGLNPKKYFTFHFIFRTVNDIKEKKKLSSNLQNPNPWGVGGGGGWSSNTIYMFIHQSRALEGHEQLLQNDYTDYNSIS